MRRDAVRAVMENYPRIYFACHTRHVKDPKTRRQVSAHHQDPVTAGLERAAGR